jgi:hypothetical protein
VTVTGLVPECLPERTGAYRYFANVVETEDTADLRSATRSEITFKVLVVDGDSVIVVDSGSTNAKSAVMPDIPTDAAYFIAATDNPATFYGPKDIDAAQQVAVVAITFVVAVEELAPVASASAGPPRGRMTTTTMPVTMRTTSPSTPVAPATSATVSQGRRPPEHGCWWHGQRHHDHPRYSSPLCWSPVWSRLALASAAITPDLHRQTE